MTLELYNFRCWKNKTFTFNEGMTLINAKSGSGKSTICEAIYWVLYGSLKNISSKESKEKETKVVLTMGNKFRITRQRPLNLFVEVQNVILQKIDAQNWINYTFGSQDLFISSSYLSQSTRHFLMTNSGSDRMSLLKEIAFGDISEINNPDYYLIKLKDEINKITMLINNVCHSKNTYVEMIKLFYSKNEKYFKDGLIESVDNELRRRDEINQLIPQYTKLYHQNEQSRKIIEKIKLLNYIPFTEHKLIEEYKNKIYYIELYRLLKDFDTRVLNFDENILINNKYLYSLYKSHGYNEKENIEDFLTIKEKQYNDYKRYLSIQNENIQNKTKYDNDMKIYNDNNKKYQDYLSKNITYENAKNELFKELDLMNIKYSELYDILSSSEHNKSKTLYNEYIKEGWNIEREQLEEFIKRKEDDIIQYKLYTENVKNKRENDMLMQIYNAKMNEYNNYLSIYDKYIKLKKDYDDFHYGNFTRYTGSSINTERDRYLYSEYIKHGYNVNSSISLFIENIKNNKKKYEEYLVILQRRKEIDNANRRNEEINTMNTITYKKEEEKYKKYINDLDKYNQINEKINIVKINENDNFTTFYVEKELLELKNLLCDLYCPHCNNGLRLKNNKLEKGSITLDQKSDIIIMINKYEDQIKQRKLKISLIKPVEIEEPSKPILLPMNEVIQCEDVKKPMLTLEEIPSLSYQSIINIEELKKRYNLMIEEPKHVEKPIEPTLIQIVDIKPLNKPLRENYLFFNIEEMKRMININKLYSIFISINKPNEILQPLLVEEYQKIENKYINETKLNIFKIPTLHLDDIISIENSKKYINKYNEFILLDEHEFESLSELKRKYKLLVERRDNNKKIEFEILNTQLNELPKIDDNVYNILKKLDEELIYINNRIETCKLSHQYNDMMKQYNKYDSEIILSSKKNEGLYKIHKMISEIGSKFLDDVIDDINSSLKFILDELFNKDINVRLTTHKQLKNKTEKLEITLEITLDGMVYDSLSFLSGGEQDRVSLALLLSFSKMKNQKIIMLDEVMSSLDDELKEKTLDIINNWNKDKIIINICHSIVNGMHDNIINL